MQFLMLALLGALVGQGMRRIRMLRHVGQIRAARSLYGRTPCCWVGQPCAPWEDSWPCWG